MRFNLDCFVIAKWISVPDVAVYSVAAVLLRYMLQFIGAGTQAVCTPRFATLDGIGDREQLRKLFLRSLSVAAVLSCAAGTLGMVLGRSFIALWVGPRFSGAAVVLHILVPCYALALAQNTGISVMYALRKHHFFAVACVVEGLANVALSIYLAPRFGIAGVAMGTALPMLAMKLLAQPVYVSRIVGVSLSQYWRHLAPPLCLGAAVVLLHRLGLPWPAAGLSYRAIALSALPLVAPFAVLYLVLRPVEQRKAVRA